jgi:transcriptional regulator NrdR family protein
MTAKSPERHSVLCPVCLAEGKVVDSRRHGGARVRRRKCDAEQCGMTWLTTEGTP